MSATRIPEFAIDWRARGDDWDLFFTWTGPATDPVSGAPIPVVPTDCSAFVITAEVYRQDDPPLSPSLVLSVDMTDPRTNLAQGMFVVVVPSSWTATALPDAEGATTTQTSVRIIVTTPRGRRSTLCIQPIGVE